LTIYPIKPIELSNLRTIPLQGRGGKVNTGLFAKPYRAGSGIAGLLDALPQILMGADFGEVVRSIVAARSAGRAILWGLGGHVIKCGLAPLLVDLMDRGFVSGFLMNGSTSIHDFEIACSGCTSEDVEAALPNGSFGITEETGRLMNEAIGAAGRNSTGIGEALGESLQRLADPRFQHASLLFSAYRRQIPVTVHVAVGTDTPHMHPAADGAAIGAATHRDFRLACTMVRSLHDGGVYLNVGSAVVLPEVFLKTVSVVRNLGYPLQNFTTVAIDFLQHYRPRVNVVGRPHAQTGGRGFYITGHHELLLPLLAAALIETAES
jgi:hypothetical protein